MFKITPFLLLIAFACGAQEATSIDTHLATGNAGIDAWTHQLDPSNNGLAIYPRSAELPLNPSSGIPFALTVGGDTYLGDVYCLADDESVSAGPGQAGCIYGKSVSGNRVGPIIYQSNSCINCGRGKGGPGVIMWADRPNIDGYGNRGYLDIWAWGRPDSAFSNTINFGNRDSSGNPHRRLRILNNGSINLPDLAGPGNAMLCIDAAGSVYRGSSTAC